MDPRLTSHVDLSVFPLQTNQLLLAPYLKESPLFAKSLTNRGLSVQYSSKKQNSTYPNDASLNACFFGNTLILNPKTTDSIIRETLYSYKQIPVRQGYTNCTVVPINETSIITDDPGIAKAAKQAALDVLMIRSGFIDLPGFQTGFIGGASLMYTKNSILFTGSLKNHPDAENIFRFLEKHEIKPDYLTDLPIFDIGSILGILEE